MKKLLLVSAVLVVAGLIYLLSRPIIVVHQPYMDAVVEPVRQTDVATNATATSSPQTVSLSAANFDLPTSKPTPAQANVGPITTPSQTTFANDHSHSITPVPLPTLIPTKELDRSSFWVPDQAFYDRARDNLHYQDDIKDFEERTPERDLPVYQAVQYTLARHLALLVTDEFFRRFNSPALYDMDIVKEVIAHGTVDTSALEVDVKIKDLTNEHSPFIDYLCGKEHCLIAWREEFQQSLNPAEELCEYINNQYGSNCKPTRLSDRLITPLEFAKASTICHASYLDDIIAESSQNCFQVVLSPTNGVLFRHDFEDYPKRQRFTSRFIEALYQTFTPDMLETRHDGDTKAYIVAITFGQSYADTAICVNNHCSVTLPNYAPKFEAFDYERLAQNLRSEQFKHYQEPWLCEPTAIDSTSLEDRPKATIEYRCYIQNICANDTFCGEITDNYNWGRHFREIWNWMNGLPSTAAMRGL